MTLLKGEASCSLALESWLADNLKLPHAESDQDLQIKALSFNEEMNTKKKRKTDFQNSKSDQEDELRKLERELSTIVQQKGVIVGQKAVCI